jgi:translocator assembly and maintenance protein 41
MVTHSEQRRDHDTENGTATVESDQSNAPAGQLTHPSQLLDIFEMMFPQDHVVDAFFYGSGIFSQQLQPTKYGDDKSDKKLQNGRQHTELNHRPLHHHLQEESTSSVTMPMLDMIIVVDDAQGWHQINQKRNRHHYSTFCKALGPNGCTYLQRNFGGRVFFFNTTIPTNHHSNNHHMITNRRLKYGVIQESDLLSDLLDWNCLYIAGRLQKPTLPILIPSRHHSTEPSTAKSVVGIMPEGRLFDAQQTNLQSALVTAFCLLLSEPTSSQKNRDHPTEPRFPNQHPTSSPSNCNHRSSVIIPWETLFEQICALSYSGDFRMNIGAEDPRKIQRLVHGPGQLQRFQQLYQRPLQVLQQQGLVLVSSPEAVNGVEIPLELVKRQSYYKNVPECFWTLLPLQLRQQVEKQQSLSRALQSIVAPAARGQAIKGLVTAGIGASIRYASAKFAKGWRR